MTFLKRLLFRYIFSPTAFSLYILIFAIAIGVATFIENDFGTSAAQKIIFKAKWFEFLLFLFAGALITNIYRFRLIPLKKWSILLFHFAMIIIIIGAGITRYTGFEGIMHIREGEGSNSIVSSDMYLKFQVALNGVKFDFDEPILLASLGETNFEKSFNLNGRILKAKILDFIPNPSEVLQFDEGGDPIIKIVFGGNQGRREYYLKKGEYKNIQGIPFNFTDQDISGAIQISENNGMPFIQSEVPFSITTMATQAQSNLQPYVKQPLQLRSLYANNNQRFVFGDFTPNGKLTVQSSSKKLTNESLAGIKMELSFAGQNQIINIYGRKGVIGVPSQMNTEEASISVSYGSKNVELPFSLFLKDFQMERYPGTNNAASYASEVVLMDPQNGIQEDHRIYMNNILIHKGYRFFQSSFDQDELGTYLSVNHDSWGTWVSYLGYFLLTLGMIMNFFGKKTRFYQISTKLKALRTSSLVLIFLFSIGFSNSLKSQNIVDFNHAKNFSSIVMQDFRGRMKPLNTFNQEVLRKLSRKNSIEGLTADQIVLGMTANPRDWYGFPIIKSPKDPQILNLLGLQKEFFAYKDFFNQDGSYKLKNEVREAYNTPEKERGIFEKELLKVDEKVNICNMVYSGSYLKVFPIAQDANNTWIAPTDLQRMGSSQGIDNFVATFQTKYLESVRMGLNSGQWTNAENLIQDLKKYQYSNGLSVMPSKLKIGSEIFLNKLNIFNHLTKIYGLLGISFVFLIFYHVFRPHNSLLIFSKILFWGLLMAFLLHTFGLALRWYVSGRAPWSNGYESMIYIGWTSTLAGLIFSRKSEGVLAATNILSATILMVAGLSWLDPEITPLVPVLKSYWLTIHVSLEAGSYGFLMLGAIIGLLNLLLICFANNTNGAGIIAKVKEMTYISEMTLIGGLFMISIGTYLGGVWANESWGRYWGWDAKETWALVTILVYAFILHMRFIPGLKSLYAFNVASLFGWASVLMTYFGVNYYLSGLHSYAAGDPVPIPDFVYYSVFILTAISLFAFFKFKKLKRNIKNISFITD